MSPDRSQPIPSSTKFSPRGKTFLGILLLDRYRKVRDMLLSNFTRRQVHKPLLKNREVILIEELLANLRPRKCLEWGSGYSTLHFPPLLDSDAHWLSVEHHEEWAEKVKALNSDPKVELKYISPNQYPWTDEDQDGAYSDLADYIEYPGQFAPYDFIFVDGRARKDCLTKAYHWLADDGVVVLHDAKRKRYHPPLKPFANQVFFIPYAYQANGLWLGSKGMPIEARLNVGRHQRIWAFHDSLVKFKRSLRKTRRRIGGAKGT